MYLAQCSIKKEINKNGYTFNSKQSLREIPSPLYHFTCYSIYEITQALRKLMHA